VIVIVKEEVLWDMAGSRNPSPTILFPPKAGVFVKETMNALADLGEKIDADPSTWSTSPP
jgi:hypothetical protein